MAWVFTILFPLQFRQHFVFKTVGAVFDGKHLTAMFSLCFISKPMLDFVSFLTCWIFQHFSFGHEVIKAFRKL